MVISSAAQFGSAGSANPGGVAHLRAPAQLAAPLSKSEDLPLVDRTVLEDLEEQLGRPDMARNFARDYSALWGQRERSLVDSLKREDHAAALDAAISLKVSSAMVGGLRLARLAQFLEGALRNGDLLLGAAVLALISLHGPATVNELQRHYLRQ